MAHALRYYKEITHADGKVIRIEFHEKDGTAAAMELGDVIQSLNLEIQGGDDIDAPIVKTQLNFTLVDAPDHQDQKTKKCGAWEEFYSPDATHWKVLVFADGVQMWGGYITPDSYHEILIYRAGISFIARDNIGHLNDFPFDATGNAEGMISMYDLVQTAWRKISSPMQLTTDSTKWLKCEGTSGINTYMNVSAFEDKNWYEVLESALYAYGLVMRYVGENKVAVYHLREMPFYGKESIGAINVKFETGAERELSPAARRIEETAEYTIEETIARPLVKASGYSGAVANVTIEGKNVFGETITKTATANPLSKTSGSGWYNPNRDGAMLLNPKVYNTTQVNDFFASDMLFLLNTKNTEVVYSAAIIAQNLNIRLAFGTAVEILNTSLTPKWFVELSQIKYAISATQNGITQYWDGSTWKSAKTELTATFEKAEVVLNCNARSFTGEITLNLHIYSVKYQSPLSSEDAAYACLNSFSFVSAESPALLTTNRVNTNYIDTNNVILTREPVLAPAMNTPFVPAVIKNGIFRKDGATYVAASAWSWNGTGAQQMAVYNHLQLLCYYGKPNNILSGTIVNADVADFAKLYKWNGTEHIIVSGVLNLVSGFIENAQLREFVHYDMMWGDLTDAADFPEVDGGTTTTADAGAQSSQTATYTNTYEVRIGGEGGTIVLDTYMSDNSTNGVQNKVIKAYVDSSISNLINGAPTTLDTLKEIADAFEESQDVVEALESAIGNKANSKDVYTREQIDDIVDDLEGADNATNARVKTLEDWKAVMDLFSAKFYLGSDGKVYCKTDLIVSGDTSSGGSGDPSTNQGIDLEELQRYLDEKGYVDADELNAAIDGLASTGYVQGQLNGLATAIGQTYATQAFVTEEIAKVNLYTDSDVAKYLGVNGYINEDNFASYGIATTTDVSNAVKDKVDKVTGKGLSTNDFTDALLTKLNGIDANAQVNVQSDWNATSGDAFIKNKPTLANVATSGAYSDLSGRPNLGDLAYLDSITKSMITDELGYVPFDAANFTKANIIDKIGTTTYAAYNANGYLPLNGGTINGIFTITGGSDRKIVLDNSDADTNWNLISFRQNGVEYGRLGTASDADLKWNSNILIHSGNYSSYALPITGGRITGNSITIGKTDNYNAAYATIAVNASTSADYGTYIRHYHSSSYKGLLITKDGAYYSDGSSNNTLIHSGNIGSYNASGAKRLVDANANSVVHISGNTFYIGDTIYPTTSTQILGKDIRLRYGESASYGLFLNSSGNVTIGASDLASTSYKLYVDGDIALSNNKTIYFKDNASNAREIITLNNINQLAIGRGNAIQGSDTYIFGNNLYFKYGQNVGVAMTITHTGDAEFTNTLRTRGNFSVTGAVTMSSTLSVSNDVTFSKGLSVGNNLTLSASSILRFGAVGDILGTSSGLEVDANLKIQGETKIYNNLIVTGDVAVS